MGELGFFTSFLRRMEDFAHVEEHNNNSQLLSLAGTQVLLLQNGPLQFLLEFLSVSYYHTHDHLLPGGTHFQI
jgi:hypothetical protein